MAWALHPRLPGGRRVCPMNNTMITDWGNDTRHFLIRRLTIPLPPGATKSASRRTPYGIHYCAPAARIPAAEMDSHPNCTLFHRALDMIKDLRYTFRTLLKNPGFTAVAVLTLGLGVGANTTIFTFINALLFRPPAGVEAPDRLMAVWNRLPNGAYLQQCYPDYAYYRDHNQVFSGLLAYSSDPTRVSWSRPGQNEIINGQVVTGNFFSVLGVTPRPGRAFLSEEDRTSEKSPVVVLADAFWRQRLGSDRGVVGGA